MQKPIYLPTRFLPPPLTPGGLARTRLLEAFDQALRQTPLTVLAAPAGSGKSTLLAQWAAGHPGAYAWCTLEAEDNDPARFWGFFVAALQQAFPGAAPDAQQILPPAVPGAPGVYLDALALGISRIPGPAAVILDDFQQIEQPGILHDLIYLVDHLPPQVHLAVASRGAPPLALPRLRAKNRVTVFSTQALVFSREESVQFLRTAPAAAAPAAAAPAAAAALTDEQMQQIFEMTAGWPAGLGLVALALRERTDPMEALAGGQTAICEYLTDEVIRRLPPDWAVLMEGTAALERFNADLAAAVLKNAGSGGPTATEAAARLEEIERAALFLSRFEARPAAEAGPEPARTVWYQFPPFFREALQRRLDPAARQAQHCRAAAWYAAQAAEFPAHGGPSPSASSALDAAIQHALAGQDWENAARWIRMEAEPCMIRGELHRLSGWIARLPESVQGASPDLQLICAALAYLQGHVPEMAIRIQNATRILDADRILDAGRIQLVREASAVNGAPLTAEQLGLLNGMRCYLALVQEDNPAAIRLGQEALAQLGSSAPFLRGMLWIALANAQHAVGEVAQAAATLQEAIRVNRSTGNLWGYPYAQANLAMEYQAMGQRRRALAACQETLEELRGADGSLPPIAGMALILLARLYLEGDQWHEAQAALNQGRALCESFGVPGLLLSAGQAEAQWLAARGQWSEAVQALNQIIRRASRSEYLGFKRQFSAARAELFLHLGDLAAAANWLDEANLPTRPEDAPARLAEFLAQAGYWLAAGQRSQALALLDQLDAFARRTGQQRLRIAILLRQAAALLQSPPGEQSAREQAARYAREALALAAPEGILRPFLDEDGPLLELLAALPETPEAIRVRAQQNLLRTQQSLPRARQSALPAAAQAQNRLPEPLTRRELDVLHGLAQQMTNQEIADQLVLSEETVKAHLRHILRKLNAANRREAVRRALEIGLI